MGKTVAHDDLMLWLESNVREKVSELGLEWRVNWRAGWQELGPCQIPEPIPTRFPYLLRTLWERPISSRHRIEGYIDMTADFMIGKPVDAHVPLFRINFEVKPRIDSLGELIRQLRTYQFHLSQQPFVVVSPDCRHERIIREQGFLFIRAPGAQTELTF
jgi:hypothetical protein